MVRPDLVDGLLIVAEADSFEHHGSRRALAIDCARSNHRAAAAERAASRLGAGDGSAGLGPRLSQRVTRRTPSSGRSGRPSNRQTRSA